MAPDLLMAGDDKWGSDVTYIYIQGIIMMRNVGGFLLACDDWWDENDRWR